MRTFSEVASSIETRPTSDEMNALLDEKISKTDLQVNIFKIKALSYQKLN
jgi:hypothetical protein